VTIRAGSAPEVRGLEPSGTFPHKGTLDRAGVYFAIMRSGQYSSTERFVLLR
jgi:hypothetical protein